MPFPVRQFRVFNVENDTRGGTFPRAAGRGARWDGIVPVEHLSAYGRKVPPDSPAQTLTRHETLLLETALVFNPERSRRGRIPISPAALVSCEPRIIVQMINPGKLPSCVIVGSTL